MYVLLGFRTLFTTFRVFNCIELINSKMECKENKFDILRLPDSIKLKNNQSKEAIGFLYL